MNELLKTFIPQSRNSKILLCIILILGLSLRLYGIKWGLPDAKHLHYSSFHPDETVSLGSSLEVLFPKSFPYAWTTAIGNGPMQFYIVAGIFKLSSAFGVINLKEKIASQHWSDLYLLGRLLTSFMSVVTIYLTFVICKKLYDEKTALLSSLFIAILATDVINAHYFRSGIPATFWLVITFLFSAQIMTSDRKIWYILAGITCGFAIATKYNMFPSPIIIVMAHIFRCNRVLKFKKVFASPIDKKILSSLGCIVISFVIACPPVILQFNETYSAILRLLKYQIFPFMDSIDRPPGWITYITRAMFYGMGLPMLILSIGGIAFSIYEKKRSDLLILIWIFVYYLIMGKCSWLVIRYTIPLMPFLMILNARTLVSIYNKKKVFVKIATTIMGSTVFIYSLLYTLSYDHIMATKDVRIETYDWINANIKNGASIGVDSNPADYYIPADRRKYKIIPVSIEQRIDWSSIQKADYYIAKDIVYRQYLRLGDYYPPQYRFYQWLMSGNQFKEIRRFEKTPEILGIKFKKGFPPHDWLYFQPTIRIFKRTKEDIQNKNSMRNS